MSDNTNNFLSLRKKYIESTFGKLNDVQKNAVFTVDGPLLILAGAGSGKTTVLVNRIANLVRFGNAYISDKIYGEISQNDIDEIEDITKTACEPSFELKRKLSVNAVRPWNILAITFTNKAAGELKSRLVNMLGEQGADVNASTFHSACVKLLRREAEVLGFPKSFTIYDSDDQQRVLKEIYKQMSIDDKFLPVKSTSSAIGRLKDKMISPKEAIMQGRDTKSALVAKLYSEYQKRLKSAGALDFDDLIYYAVTVLEDNLEIRENYQNKFKYVLVDEYQDTSIAQFRLVSLLTGPNQNICVVGDDDQSIYRFRGATIENILSFESCFRAAKVVRLEQNYRSTSNILAAANCVIKNNLGRKGKTLWTQNDCGDKISYFNAQSEHEEAEHIVQTIGQNIKKGANLRDHAILYRMNAQSGPIETYFARAGIPYKIVGGQRFFDRKEVKDILAYMSIVANANDNLRLKRIINEPTRKIGTTTIDLIASIANEQDLPMLEVIRTMERYPALQRAYSAIGGFYKIYAKLLIAAENLSLDELVSEILDVTGYKAMLVAQNEEGQTRLENIGQLISSVKTYADQRGNEASLPGYLEEVALISDLDSYDENSDVVVMMTMHAAKGLEFDYVFIAGLEDGVFPSDMSKYSSEDLEEERRLCYVGITRARKELYLSGAACRMLFGQTKYNRPSMFLSEIDPDLLSIEKGVNNIAQSQGRDVFYSQNRAAPQIIRPSGERANRSLPTSSVLTTKTIPAMNVVKPPVANRGVPTVFAPGNIVEHKVFGKGQVLKTTPVAGDTIVEISFEKVGVKKTMANYAPLTLVSEK